MQHINLQYRWEFPPESLQKWAQSWVSAGTRQQEGTGRLGMLPLATNAATAENLLRTPLCLWHNLACMRPMLACLETGACLFDVRRFQQELRQRVGALRARCILACSRHVAGRGLANVSGW